MVRDEVSCGEKDAEPAQPGHSKDAAIEGENGELDDADTPRVNQNVSECRLIGMLAHSGACSWTLLFSGESAQY